MFVQRSAGELYLQGTVNPEDPRAYGWVERVDPVSLERLAWSGELPCGGHVWCGAASVHANGDIYTINGSFVHRLDPQCVVVKERRLPVDWAHNGFLILPDGAIVTKDLRLEGQSPSTMTLLSPDLEVIDTLVLPEPSMGRIAADGFRIIVPGTEHFFAIEAANGKLERDDLWRPRYRSAAGAQGLAWDSCLAAGNAWVMDNGDIASVREIFSVHPNGHFPVGQRQLGLGQPTPWRGEQRALRVNLVSGDMTAFSPFGLPGGYIIAPPVFVEPQNTLVCWDSANSKLAALDPDGALIWMRDMRVTMQPIVYPDSGELVVNDFRVRERSDDLVVLDLQTGAELARAETGSNVANGMFLTPGWDRDVYYCSRWHVARVAIGVTGVG
jgi:outer membrane protein assembly factor BamB